MSVWLGFSAKGIGVYEPSDKVHPQEVEVYITVELC